MSKWSTHFSLLLLNEVRSVKATKHSEIKKVTFGGIKQYL